MVQKHKATLAQQRIIAVMSGKGGAGKSTTALALAAIAARYGRRVVLVDLDPIGGATFGAGLDPATLRGTAEVFAGVPAREVLVTVADGFAVLGATPALDDESKADRLPRLLAQLVDFELVIIDTPPGFGAFVKAAAAAATEILVPIVAEPMATRTAQYVLGMLDGLGVDRKRVVGFLPTQHEARRVLSRDQLDELAELDVPVLAPIPNGVAAAEAPLAGEAVTSYAPRSSVAVAYDALARLIKL
jgi:chromosome partitioning protein